MKRDYVASIAEQLIAQLEAGTAPWVKPWRPGARFMPFNPITGKDYRGMNAVILLMTAEALGYGDARWMTYKQAASEGGQVRRGEKSTLIQYWKWREERPVIGADGAPLRDADGKAIIEVVELVRPRVFAAAVFNGAQIDGLVEQEARPALPEWQRHELAEAILTNSGARIQHLACDRAAYNRILDAIVLPERSQFPSADGYYATALHELGHWTGHATRLNRDLAHPFGSQGYAREELRAEIASLMLGDRLGIGHDPSQHAAYVGHFLQILRSEPQEVFRAASDAEKIVTFLQRFQQTQTADQMVTAERGIALPASASGERSSAPAQAAERVFLAVPYAEKDEAKALGAKWDRRARSWYLPAGIDPAPFARWRQGVVARALPEDQRLEFSEALQAAGLLIDGLPVMDGKLRRVPVDGDRKGQRSGAYVGYLDAHPAGFLENFRTGVRENWKSQTPQEALSADARARLIAEAAESRRQREAERQAIAAETARFVETHLAGLQLPASTRHPYLQRKGVGAHGVYVNTAGPLLLNAGETEPQVWSAKGDLIVPIRDAGGTLLGAQSIAADGRKSFTRGAAIAGGHHLIGTLAPGGMLLIAEGYATAATLHEITGLPVAVAFHASNLLPVAQGYRAADAGLRILIAGDNDHQREREIGADGRPKGNVGRAKAEAAAGVIGSDALIPPFEPHQSGSDWNDLAQLLGDRLRPVLDAALAAAERRLTAGRARRGGEDAQPRPKRSLQSTR
jgi:putative DNA primase/helicase